MTGKTEDGRLFAKLKKRRAQYAPAAPRIRWKTWALVTAILVALAMYFLDVELTYAARELPGWFRSLSLFATDFGNSGWILTLCAIVFAISLWRIKNGGLPQVRDEARYWATATAFLFLSIALSGIFSNLAKRLIGRARPRMFDELGAFHFDPIANSSAFQSFPSGHSTTDGAIMMGFAILFPTFRLPILVLGFTLAMTRVFVGAHYLSDVIAGYSFGMWYAYMSAIFFAHYGFYVTRR